METITLILGLLFIIQCFVIIRLRADFYKYKVKNDQYIKEKLKTVADNSFNNTTMILSLQERVSFTDKKRSDKIKDINGEISEVNRGLSFCMDSLGIKKSLLNIFPQLTFSYLNQNMTPVNQEKRLLALERQLNLEYKSETTEGYVLRETPKK